MAQRVLFLSPAVSIVDYCCDGFDSRADERAVDAEIVFVRAGAFRVESERGRAISDPTRAVLLRPGERYRISHPGPADDRCLVMTVPAGTLAELVSGVATGAEAGIPDLAVPCRPEIYMAQRRLIARLQRREDDLAVAEQALAILASLIGSARPAPPPGPRGARDDDERVDAVRTLLAERYAERLSLAEIGARVGLSPFRIARLYRAATGASIHGHRLDLRLRAAVERLAAGASDLTALALDLGFADHAHFTNTFRRRFGMTPSRYRASAAGAN